MHPGDYDEDSEIFNSRRGYSNLIHVHTNFNLNSNHEKNTLGKERRSSFDGRAPHYPPPGGGAQPSLENLPLPGTSHTSGGEFTPRHGPRVPDNRWEDGCTASINAQITIDVGSGSRTQSTPAARQYIKPPRYNNRYTRMKIEKDALIKIRTGFVHFFNFNSFNMLKGVWVKEIIPRKRLGEAAEFSKTSDRDGGDPKSIMSSSDSEIECLGEFENESIVIDEIMIKEEKGSSSLNDKNYERSVSGKEEMMENKGSKEEKKMCEDIKSGYYPRTQVRSWFERSEEENYLNEGIRLNITSVDSADGKSGKKYVQNLVDSNSPSHQRNEELVSVSQSYDANRNQRCKYYLAGRSCFRGSACRYLHRFPRDDDILCKAFLVQMCKYGSACMYKHAKGCDEYKHLKGCDEKEEEKDGKGLPEKAIDGNFRKRCKAFLKNRQCSRGKECKFLHRLPKEDDIFCKHFQAGNCTKKAEMCNYKHGEGSDVVENSSGENSRAIEECDVEIDNSTLTSVGLILKSLKPQQPKEKSVDERERSEMKATRWESVTTRDILVERRHASRKPGSDPVDKIAVKTAGSVLPNPSEIPVIAKDLPPTEQCLDRNEISLSGVNKEAVEPPTLSLSKDYRQSRGIEFQEKTEKRVSVIPPSLLKPLKEMSKNASNSHDEGSSHSLSPLQTNGSLCDAQSRDEHRDKASKSTVSASGLNSVIKTNPALLPVEYHKTRSSTGELCSKSTMSLSNVGTQNLENDQKIIQPLVTKEGEGKSHQSIDSCTVERTNRRESSKDHEDSRVSHNDNRQTGDSECSPDIPCPLDNGKSSENNSRSVLGNEMSEVGVSKTSEVSGVYKPMGESSSEQPGLCKSTEESGLCKPTGELSLEQPGLCKSTEETGLYRPREETGLYKPTGESSSEQPGLCKSTEETGLYKSTGESSLEQAGLRKSTEGTGLCKLTGESSSEQPGLRKSTEESGLYKPTGESSLEQPGLRKSTEQSGLYRPTGESSLEQPGLCKSTEESGLYRPTGESSLEQPGLCKSTEESSPEQPGLYKPTEKSSSKQPKRYKSTDESSSEPPELDKPTEESSSEQTRLYKPTEKSSSKQPERYKSTDESSSELPELDEPTEESSPELPELDNPTDESSSEQPGLYKPTEKSSSKQPERYKSTDELSSELPELDSPTEESSLELPELDEPTEESSSGSFEHKQESIQDGQPHSTDVETVNTSVKSLKEMKSHDDQLPKRPTHLQAHKDSVEVCSGNKTSEPNDCGGLIGKVSKDEIHKRAESSSYKDTRSVSSDSTGSPSRSDDMQPKRKKHCLALEDKMDIERQTEHRTEKQHFEHEKKPYKPCPKSRKNKYSHVEPRLLAHKVSPVGVEPGNETSKQSRSDHVVGREVKDKIDKEEVAKNTISLNIAEEVQYKKGETGSFGTSEKNVTKESTNGVHHKKSRKKLATDSGLIECSVILSRSDDIQPKVPELVSYETKKGCENLSRKSKRKTIRTPIRIRIPKDILPYGTDIEAKKKKDKTKIKTKTSGEKQKETQILEQDQATIQPAIRFRIVRDRRPHGTDMERKKEKKQTKSKTGTSCEKQTETPHFEQELHAIEAPMRTQIPKDELPRCSGIEGGTGLPKSPHPITNTHNLKSLRAPELDQKSHANQSSKSITPIQSSKVLAVVKPGKKTGEKSYPSYSTDKTSKVEGYERRKESGRKDEKHLLASHKKSSTNMPSTVSVAPNSVPRKDKKRNLASGLTELSLESSLPACEDVQVLHVFKKRKDLPHDDRYSSHSARKKRERGSPLAPSEPMHHIEDDGNGFPVRSATTREDLFYFTAKISGFEGILGEEDFSELLSNFMMTYKEFTNWNVLSSEMSDKYVVLEANLRILIAYVFKGEEEALKIKNSLIDHWKKEPDLRKFKLEMQLSKTL